MPYCPTHGLKSGIHCDECGAALQAPPPGDSVKIRSGEAHVHNTLNPTFVMPGGQAHVAPQLVKCPRCGWRNDEIEVFDCQGPCDRQNLCRRHFDEEYEVCKDCAALLRGEAERASAAQEALRKLQGECDAALATQRQSEIARQAAIQAGDAQRRSAEQLQREADAAQARIAALQQELAAAQEARRQSASASEAVTRALAEQRTRAEQLQRELAAAQETVRQAQQERDAARTVPNESYTQVVNLHRMLEDRDAALAAAQAELAPYRKAAEEAARRAEKERCIREAKQAAPIWLTIGIEMVKIPAGAFLYGENKQKVRLPEFSISKTTVTNRQYQAFVAATGYAAPSHWQSGRPVTGTEDHPVVNVSWEDAQAFCRWAGVRLPEEREWEKAARGTDGREYPWGSQKPNDKLCNFNKEWKIENLAPVGSYPAGASPYGLLDMAGNVWEWCEDWSDAQAQFRVLRGGSFDGNGNHVRCASRLRDSPSNRHGYVGFRVASPGF